MRKNINAFCLYETNSASAISLSHGFPKIFVHPGKGNQSMVSGVQTSDCPISPPISGHAGQFFPITGHAVPHCCVCVCVVGTNLYHKSIWDPSIYAEWNASSFHSIFSVDLASSGLVPIIPPENPSMFPLLPVCLAACMYFLPCAFILLSYFITSE